jgi:hypothetical protein
MDLKLAGKRALVTAVAAGSTRPLPRRSQLRVPSSSCADVTVRESHIERRRRESMAATERITKELYDAFQKLELDRWDGIVANDVLINSPAGRDLRGIEILKSWAKEFGGGFAYQIDLVDEHLALDDQGNGRGFITFNLHWKHAKEVFGLKPTGREGTSVETMLLTIRHGKVTRIDVADNSLDLVIYMWDRGWNHPHNVRPDALIRGVDRRSEPQPATV